MQTKWIWALALLNVFLLVGLLTHWMPTRAEAQAAGGHPGDYLMIPGAIQGGSGGSVVYIIDQNTGALTYMQYTGQVGAPIGAAQPVDLNRLLNR
ncbi:MAG TPA: hypothetical protein VHY37_14325 [Tepidisphaeraceae bacterium]|jgi:hypothetical protein|nr:hypothetical protein [Tepidisphaeraceae bacterium]